MAESSKVVSATRKIHCIMMIGGPEIDKTHAADANGQQNQLGQRERWKSSMTGRSLQRETGMHERSGHPIRPHGQDTGMSARRSRW